MKLPGIQYGTAVPSFGQRDVTAGLRVANAWTNAVNAWDKALKDVADQTNKTEAYEAEMQARRKMDEMELQLQQGTWNAKELGQPPAEVKIKTRQALGDQDYYETHEFAGAMYDFTANKTIAEFAKPLSRDAKRIFTERMMEYSLKGSSRVREAQFERAIDYGKASLDNALSGLTSGATWDNIDNTILDANQMIADSVKTWGLGRVDAEEIRKQVLDDATSAALLNEVRTATSESELDAIEASVFNRTINGQPVRMSRERLEGAMRQVDKRKAELDKEEEDRHKTNFRFATVGVMRGELSQADIADLIAEGAIDAQQGRSLFKDFKEGKATEADYKDESARNYWAGQVRRLRYGIGDEETLRERNVRLSKDINAAADGFYSDGTPYQGARMSQTDAAWALEQLDKQYNKVLSHPEMKQVLADIKTASGMDGIVDIDKSSNNRKAQLAFTRAAWSYYDRMGVDADMREWFEQNKAAYDPGNFNLGTEFERMYALGVPRGLTTQAQIAAWANSPEAQNISPENLRAIKETLLPVAAPDMEEEAANNATPAAGLTESR